MGGVTKGEQEKLLGVQGLERLCKTYGSADYLERAMRDWSDDVFFLDIWEGLQDRARGKTSNIGTMSVADVAERTSRNVENDDGGSLFDETASWYARLRDRSEGIIIDTLNSNVREALRPYRNINPWATLSGPSASASNATDLSPTAEIDPLLTYLRTTLSFLSRALATAPLRRITRAVLTTISTVIWDNVLTSNRYRFSTQGAAQLSVDLGAVCRVVNEHVGPFVAEAGLRKCLEGVKLVGLPVKGSPGSQSAVGRNEKSTHDASGDDEEWDTEAWGAEDGDDEAPRDDGPQKASANREQTSSEGDDGIELGLWEVERRVFADNQSARDVLDELGLELLDEKEARALMMLRVELAG
ncbi:RINT-1 family protein [Pyrenophora tritici-repentis]|nr:RINT-1 family protein [Pyrenophora tritici-repentis]KAF7445221.1 RINT-1 family protein [Pyrenophora tritici-repentis]KAI2478526.1 RINT-1 family protein [Pyrenophora tritici-repentis]